MRNLKAKDLKGFGFVAPAAEERELNHRFVGNFDPDYYKSDRKEQTSDEIVIVAPKRRSEGAGSRDGERTHYRRGPEFHTRPGQ